MSPHSVHITTANIFHLHEWENHTSSQKRIKLPKRMKMTSECAYVMYIHLVHTCRSRIDYTSMNQILFHLSEQHPNISRWENADWKLQFRFRQLMYIYMEHKYSRMPPAPLVLYTPFYLNWILDYIIVVGWLFQHINWFSDDMIPIELKFAECSISPTKKKILFLSTLQEGRKTFQ